MSYITYGEMDSTMDSLWNFLFFNGYLTKVSEYENHIRGWFEQRVAQMDLGALFSATLTGDTETMETEIGRMLLEKSCEAALFTGRTAV